MSVEYDVVSLSTSRDSASPVTSQTSRPKRETSRCTGSSSRVAPSRADGDITSRCRGQDNESGTLSSRDRSMPPAREIRRSRTAFFTVVTRLIATPLLATATWGVYEAWDGLASGTPPTGLVRRPWSSPEPVFAIHCPEWSMNDMIQGREDHMTDELPPYTPAREMTAYPSYPPLVVPALAYGPPSHEGGPPSKTMATWALVLGIVPMPSATWWRSGWRSTSCRDSRDGRNHGKGQAIVALVVAPPVAALSSSSCSPRELSGQADRNQGGVVTARGDVSVDALVVGDCLPRAIDGRRLQRTIEVVPCSDAHRGEVYANFDLAKGPFPGNAQVQRLADGGCSKRIEHHRSGSRRTPRSWRRFVLHPVRRRRGHWTAASPASSAQGHPPPGR